MNNVDIFVKNLYPIAQDIEKRYGIPAIYQIARSAVETGWGSKAPGNMFFGIKAGSNWAGKKQLITTTEYSTNKNLKFPVVINIEPQSNGMYKYTVKDYFRAYDEPAGSFEDHAKLLMTTRYKGALSQASDPTAYAIAISKAGYSTNPAAIKLLTDVVDMVKKKLVG
jgi:flagellum-specific peptidoglycan hydrolase FlgJ